VTLQRTTAAPEERSEAMHEERREEQVLASFSVASAPGNERQAMREVAAAVEPLHLEPRQLQRLQTAVAEATMNAMEHGNKYQPDVPVQIEVAASGHDLAVRVTDQGGGQPIPDAEAPDLAAKLANQQTPRGWGLFLIQNMVDELTVTSDATHHTMQLVMHLRGHHDAYQTA
jgi:anti-sigma regulatory factor (Ser/Thr protein kinase)